MKNVICLLGLLLLVGSCGGVNPKGRVKNVERGDLIVVPSTFTDNNSLEMNVRLLGIICPNIDSDQLVEAYYGSLAKKFTEKWLNKKLVRLERPIKKADGIRDRRLAFVVDAESKEYLHEALLKAGLAKAFLDDRKFKEKEPRILALEAAARKEGAGMWASKHPPTHEMREEVKDSTSMLKSIANVVMGKKYAEEAQETQATNNTQHLVNNVDTLPAGERTDLAMALGRLSKMQASTRLNYKKWESAPPAERLATAEDIRQAMRYIKIQIEDVLDDYGAELKPAQIEELKVSQDDLSQLMQELKKVIKSK